MSSNLVATNYTMVAHDANSRVWAKSFPLMTNGLGRVIYHTNSYTELATGMCPSGERPVGGIVREHPDHRRRWRGHLMDRIKLTSPLISICPMRFRLSRLTASS